MGRGFFSSLADSGVGSDSSTHKINVKKKGRHKKRKKSAKIAEREEDISDKGSLGKDGPSSITNRVNADEFSANSCHQNQVKMPGVQDDRRTCESVLIAADSNVDKVLQTDKSSSTQTTRQLVENAVDPNTAQKLGHSELEGELDERNKDLNISQQGSSSDVKTNSHSKDCEDPADVSYSSQKFNFKDFSPAKSDPLEPELSSVTAVGELNISDKNL